MSTSDSTLDVAVNIPASKLAPAPDKVLANRLLVEFFDAVKSHAVIALAFVKVPVPESVMVPASDQPFWSAVSFVTLYTIPASAGTPGPKRAKAARAPSAQARKAMVPGFRLKRALAATKPAAVLGESVD